MKWENKREKMKGKREKQKDEKKEEIQKESLNFFSPIQKKWS